MGATGHGTTSAHRYYVRRPVKGQKIACSMNWVPADNLEDPILDRLSRVLIDEAWPQLVETWLATIGMISQ
jgi:hypothetical protein